MITERAKLNLASHVRIEFGTSVSDLEKGEIRIVTTVRRDAKRFAGYLLPVWVACKEDKYIILVSPTRRSKVKSCFDGLSTINIFSDEGLSRSACLANSINGVL